MTVTTFGTTSNVDLLGRTVEGVCVPYGETTYLTQNPNGERVTAGAFRSATRRPGKIFLFRSHDHANPVGKALNFTDRPDGLHGTFWIRESVAGDQTLADIKDGYLPGLSVGFRPLRTRVGAHGETEVVEAELREVSLVPIAAYDGARVLAVRTAYAVPDRVGPMEWHAPPHLAHLIRPRPDPGTIPTVRRPAAATPRADAGMVVTWHASPGCARYLPDQTREDRRR